MAAPKKEEVKLDIPLKGVKAKLQTARVALMEKGLTKTGKNDFAHFNFFQLKDFLPEAQRIFAKIGLYSHFSLMPEVVAYEEVIEGEKVFRKPIIRDIATLIIKDMESEEVETYKMETAPVQIGNNTKQNIYQAAGGRSTYYKRYLYRDALEIEEDDESDTVLGQPGVQYTQAPVQNVTPYDFQQPVSIQQDIVAQPVVNVAPPVENVGEPVVINPTTQEVVVGNPDDLLSQESKINIMNIITGKGLDGFSVINQYCSLNGIASPDALKEKDNASLIAYINTL